MEQIASLRGNIWHINNHAKTEAEAATALLSHYGLDDPKIASRTLLPTLADLPSPWDLHDIKPAINRLQKAIAAQEKIMIFGDFDADGIMSTSLLVHGIKALGGQVSYRIPDREKDSHGLKPHLIDAIAETGTTLIVTCDCGINDAPEVAYAASKGIDVIITDHHEADPARTPTAAVAALNPHQAKDTSGQTELAGVGVAFQMLLALAECELMQDDLAAFIQPYLELVAIGTIADCAPLVRANRILCHFGLRQMEQSHWDGIRLLLEGHEGPITDETIGFSVAPLLNAASRLGDVTHAVQLIIGAQAKHPQRIAYLRELNTRRKTLTKTFLEDARAQCVPDAPAQVCHVPQCPAGVCGLVAGRLCEALGVPVIVAYTRQDGDIGASCRAPEGGNVIGALTETAEQFTYFGGHDAAAGFRCTAANFSPIKDHIQAWYAARPMPQKKLNIALTLNSTNILTTDFGRAIQTLGPFGSAWETPLFLLLNVTIQQITPLGKDGQHLQIEGVFDHVSIRIQAFFAAKWLHEMRAGGAYDLVVQLQNSVWRGQERLDIRLVDARKKVA